MPADPPDGIKPLFLRGVTTEKFGMKTGEGITDLVDSMYIKTSDILDEVQTLGKMSDWEPAKKELQDYPEEEILIVVDLKQEYGEMFLLVTTLEAKEEYEKKLKDAADAIAAQKKAEEEAEAARVAAEYERLNRVYEDKPIEPRPWETDTMADTEEYVDGLKFVAYRDPIVLEITRPKKQIGQNLRFFDRNAEFSGVHEFKPQKDPNFKEVVERDIGFQAAPFLVDSPAQTSWNRLVNKSIQYEGRKSDDLIENMKDQLLGFLEKNLHAVESALQQNESVDIFNDTFDLVGMEDVQDNSSTANELKEVKNFADPTYSKFKALVAIDWLPNMPGMLAVSAVKNITFDARAAKSGMISTSHLLIWDFKQLVKPSLVLQCQHEILCFKFNKANPGLIIGGTMTGQVVMWDIADALRRSNNKNDDNDDAGKDGDDDSTPLAPILQSSIDFSHKKGVADIFWLPPDTQINFRGNLVADEHLDGQQYQFITISGDGCVFVWDIRYKDIAREELKHIGRAKSVPIEKQKNKDDEPKVLFAPIYKAALKRTEGVGEFSLNKLNAVSIVPAAVKEQSTVEGDKRAQIVVGTEEGDVLYVDLCVPAKGASHAVDDDAADEREGSAREYVRWTQIDHARPSVSVQLCPFFPDLVLTVSDWNFHVWKIGNDKPLYISPNHNHYLTCGMWSPTRPAVIILADATGHFQVWDFTDSSNKPSVVLKATHEKIVSMEFMPSTNTRQQLVAIGDEVGTLHIYEMPRSLIRPVPREEEIMTHFLSREWERIEYLEAIPNIDGFGTVDHLLSQVERAGTAETEMPGLDDAAAAGLEEVTPEGGEDEEEEDFAMTATGEGLGGGAQGGAVLDKKALREQFKKEEEDYLKMEAAFLEELGIDVETLPDAIRATMLSSPEKK